MWHWKKMYCPLEQSQILGQILMNKICVILLRVQVFRVTMSY